MNPPKRSRAPRAVPAENRYQAATSPEKLRGRYYTPPELVRLMLTASELRPGERVLDPSCGDGAFLVGAVEYLADLLPARSVENACQVAACLHGFDVDAEAAAETRNRVREALRARYGPEAAEQAAAGLEARIHTRDALELPTRAALLHALPGAEQRLLVVGNPPYVEAKRLPARTRARLKEVFPQATGGAPDLYLFFLHVCLNWLDAEDHLALVLPNKLLVNSNARALRERLLFERRLRGVEFATQAEVFPDASVYPIVLHAGAARDGAVDESPVRLTRIHRAEGDRDGEVSLSLEELPPLDSQLFAATEGLAIFPSPVGESAAKALRSLVERLGEGRLDDVLDIRWSISFHRAGLRERYITRDRPNLLYARKVLGGGAYAGNGEVGRYTLTWDGWWMNYDEAALRAEGNHIPPATMFEATKVVICQNGRTLRAAYDSDGYVLKDTFLCGLLREVDHPLVRQPHALVGLLCSRTVHFFYSHVFHGSHVNGGYLHFLRSFLVDVPLGCWTEADAEQVAVLVRQREQEAEPDAALRLEEEIETYVEAVLGLGADEQAAVYAWAKSDPNWLARERIRRPSVGGKVREIKCVRSSACHGSGL
jgi:hypothetical protein